MKVMRGRGIGKRQQLKRGARKRVARVRFHGLGRSKCGPKPHGEQMRPQQPRPQSNRNDVAQQVLCRMGALCGNADGCVELVVDLVHVRVERWDVQKAVILPRRSRHDYVSIRVHGASEGKIFQ
jgi:hypothetical protein